MPVKITRNRLDAVIAAFHFLSGVELVVGIPEENSKRDDGEATNALIAKIAEDGSPANNIPARPVLKPGMARARDEIVGHYRKAALALLAGKPGEVAPQIAAAGEAAVRGVRRELLTGSHAPLKPATLARRRAKGSTSSLPLYDTTQLYNAYGYELRMKKDKP